MVEAFLPEPSPRGRRKPDWSWILETMKKLSKIRNIGISAHIDSGKTTLTERILFYAGRIHRMKEVRGGEGGATMDFMDLERERGITITSAATQVEWNNCVFNLIDTPGHVDFTVEVERSLRVLDGAVAVFCGVGGVEAQSETVWRQAERYGVPRLCFVNKLDRPGGDFGRVVEEIRQRLQGNPVPVQIPIGRDARLAGQIDLITMKAYIYHADDVATEMTVGEIPDEYVEQAEAARAAMIEQIGEADDALMDLYIHEKPICEDDIRAAMRRATCAGAIQPVLCGSALKHIGVRPLLDAVVAYLPSPEDVPAVEGHADDDSEGMITRNADPNAPMCGLVFKISSDKHGDLYFARIYSGILKAGTRVLNATRGKKEIVSRIWELYAKQRIRRDEAGPGDIVALVGCKHSLTGDTLADPRNPIILEKMEFPDTVISMSIEPRSSADKQKLAVALGVLRREDPTFRSAFHEETGQTLISGMGELHLEIIHNKLRRDMGVDVKVGKPRVAYKETILGKAEAEGRFIRQTGGRGQYGVVKIVVEPFEPDGSEEPIAFESALTGESVPRQYVPAVEEGIRGAAQSGALSGYPMVNVKATLIDGKHHPIDSSDIAFEQASSLAYTAAVEKAEPVFMEPIMSLQVVCPEEFLGAVTGDLNARRAEIGQMEMRASMRVIEAKVPLAEAFGYTNSLRSLTQGRATSTMEPSHYAVVPRQVAAALMR